MLVIQHRANFPPTNAKTAVAEIDVQIDNQGRVVVGHNPDGIFHTAEFFLKHTKFKKFFIDIKQNLPVEYLHKIMATFRGKSIGLFDVPMPSAYFLTRSGAAFYQRLSEFEPVQYLSNKFWLDPLSYQDPEAFLNVLRRTQQNQEVVFASPELHNNSFEEAKRVWLALRIYNYHNRNNAKIAGVVTKYPEEFTEFWNEKIYI